MNKLHVKTGDTVFIISGADKNKKGKVLEVSPSEQKIIVEGLNLVTKHIKPKAVGQQGTIVKAEAPMYACKAMVVCPECGKPTRVGHQVVNGKKMRACKKCSKTF